MQGKHVLVSFANKLPGEDDAGFYAMVICLKRQHLFVPKDILKILHAEIRVMKYNNTYVYNPGESICPLFFEGDFILVAAAGQKWRDGNPPPIAIVSLDDYDIEVGYQPILIYREAMRHQTIKFLRRAIIVESYSFKDPLSFNSLDLQKIAINQIIQDHMLYYRDGRPNFYINKPMTTEYTKHVDHLVRLGVLKITPVQNSVI